MKNISGQITVFLSIVLLSVILLACVLVEVSRVTAGETIVKKAARSAARSMLAGYSSTLKDNYGLFAYGSNNTNDLDKVVEEYLEKNLNMDDVNGKTTGNTRLYDFKIEKVSVSPVFNLSENDVFKQQILEYMKYRAPKQIVDGFIDKLSMVKDMGKLSQAYKKKVGIDKILGRMDKSQQKLKKSLDGGEGTQKEFVNGFNKNGIWKDTYDSYITMNTQLASLKNNLQNIEALIQNSISKSLNITKENQDLNISDDNNDSEKEQSEDKNRIDELLEEKEEIIINISSLTTSISAVWNNLRYALTEDYIRLNASSLEESFNIIKLGKDAEALVSELESFVMQNINSSNSCSSNFVDILVKDITNIKDLLLYGKRAIEITGQLENNKKVLMDIATKLDLLKESMENDNIGTGGKVGLGDEVLQQLKNYTAVSYSYEKPVKQGNETDPRKNLMQKLKEALTEKFADDKSYIDIGIAQEELPSVKKKRSATYEDEDSAYINQVDSITRDKPITEQSVEYDGVLENIEKDVNLDDEEGTFQENALAFASSIGKLLEGDLKKLVDNIYINEYIMGMFKNQVPALKEGKSSDNFINGLSRGNKKTLYESEVEYILHGNASEALNRTMTEAQILLIRFGADTLHVYTDPVKKEKAIAVATAIAGWWTGGAGIPIVSNLIMCSWGMGEALIDLKNLKAGKLVPFYKSKGDWQLDIGLTKTEVPVVEAEAGKKLSFSYHDYLRLLLLLMNEDKKLGRMEDLIEINTGMSKAGFKVCDYNTYVRVEAEVSIGNLFISKGFIPSVIRAKDGRHSIRVLVYEGY